MPRSNEDPPGHVANGLKEIHYEPYSPIIRLSLSLNHLTLSITSLPEAILIFCSFSTPDIS